MPRNYELYFTSVKPSFNSRTSMRIMNKFMKRKSIDFELQGKIRCYLDYILKESQEESSAKEQSLISRLSVSLRKELLLQANGKILMNSPVLKNNFSAKTIERLAEVITPMDLAPEDYVFEVVIFL